MVVVDGLFLDAEHTQSTQRRKGLQSENGVAKPAGLQNVWRWGVLSQRALVLRTAGDSRPYLALGQAHGRALRYDYFSPGSGEKVAGGRMRGMKVSSFKFEVFSFKFRTTVVIGFLSGSKK